MKALAYEVWLISAVSRIIRKWCGDIPKSKCNFLWDYYESKLNIENIPLSQISPRIYKNFDLKWIVVLTKKMPLIFLIFSSWKTMYKMHTSAAF